MFKINIFHKLFIGFCGKSGEKKRKNGFLHNSTQKASKKNGEQIGKKSDAEG